MNTSSVPDFEGFPDEVSEDVDGLIWLGFLEETVEFCGHHFTLRTLRGDEELLAALVTKDYVETLGQAKAQAWATIGLSLVAVDGDENFCPPAGPDRTAYARARFNYVAENWYWPTCVFLFDTYAGLLERQVEAFKAVQNLSRRSPRLSSALRDFSTVKADSPQAIMDLLAQDEEPPSTPSSDDS